ncbi:DUF4350 domain-containing protein [Cytobacillus dafuensis]|uniref:DUF4350 domain-containing protein n=1 Tax=Cytobacillus dafuensis TaxID=1742359 RepID=A0A5B8Z3W6_CYTDA|nr:DUF4350 domain-containing protein [Cytobacillus dafuensis]QED47794.1 DUF4350 domain-containing protein [Cytobacillus dafuensis]
MQNAKSNRRAWLWFIVLLILFMIIGFFAFSPEPKQYPNYVSDSPSPTGVKALYTYLDDNMQAKRWSHEPKLLPKMGKKQTLIMTEPFFVPKHEEMEAFKKFIEAGNTVLLLKKNPKGMFDIKTFPIEEEPSSDQVFEIHNSENTSYKAEISSPFRLKTEPEDIILLKDKAGPVAVKRNIGNGDLIVAVTPEWMMNGKLLNNDHLTLVISLLNEGNANSILFDEFTHGGQNASTISALYPKWFLLLMLQGAIILFLWLWYSGKRFGPIYIPRIESVRFSDEGLRALASWYMKGRRYHDSLLIQADYVKLLLQERWGIPYYKQWTDLASYLEKKCNRMSSTEVQDYIIGIESILRKEKINKQEYLLWSKKIDQLRKEVEEG